MAQPAIRLLRRTEQAASGRAAGFAACLPVGRVPVLDVQVHLTATGNGYPPHGRRAILRAGRPRRPRHHRVSGHVPAGTCRGTHAAGLASAGPTRPGCQRRAPSRPRHGCPCLSAAGRMLPCPPTTWTCFAHRWWQLLPLTCPVGPRRPNPSGVSEKAATSWSTPRCSAARALTCSPTPAPLCSSATRWTAVAGSRSAPTSSSAPETQNSTWTH